jgi:hypothetical protein
MSEEVMNIVWLMRYRFPNWVLEVMAITPNAVIIAKLKESKASILVQWNASLVGARVSYILDKKAEKKKLSLDEVIESDKKKVTIPIAEVKKVELKKAFNGIKLEVVGKKKYGFYAKSIGLDNRPSVSSTAPEGFGLEDFEKILRPFFGDTLAVKK